MKKLALFVALFAGSVAAQGVDPCTLSVGNPCFEFWTWDIPPGLPIGPPPYTGGFTNMYIPRGAYAPYVEQNAYCTEIPYPGAKVGMEFSLFSSCPQGGYVSEDAEDYGPNQIEFGNGSVIDIQLFIQEQFRVRDECSGPGPLVEYDEFRGCYL